MPKDLIAEVAEALNACNCGCIEAKDFIAHADKILRERFEVRLVTSSPDVPAPGVRTWTCGLAYHGAAYSYILVPRSPAPVSVEDAARALLDTWDHEHSVSRGPGISVRVDALRAALKEAKR